VFREKKRNRRQKENALTLAKRRAITGIIPLITTLLFLIRGRHPVEP